MALSLNALRSAIQQQIEGISGMKVSPHPPDYFGRIQQSIAHKAFTVELMGVSASQDRQRRNVGVYVATEVRVKFAFRFRPLDLYPTDYDNALLLEKDVILKCLDSYATINGEVQIRFGDSSRISTASNEYSIHTLNFTAYHTLL